jgi:hypothetical protein
MIKNLINLINTFGKVAGYNTSIWKSVAFSYANNEQADKIIRKAMQFTIAPQSWNAWEKNVTTEVKFL